jgi:lipid-A-disaccharide synthase
MADEWRTLLYPLGYLSGIAFGSRFFIQWLASEKKKQSYCPPIFWYLSLLGNFLLALHAIIQLQFHVSIIQGCNGVIAWRNLNLMRPAKERASIKKVLLLMAGVLLLITALFAAQSIIFPSTEINWLRGPVAASAISLIYFDSFSKSYLWHLFGFIGMALFSSRFWVQWWHAEKSGKSELGPAFWWLSLAGDVMTLLYFFSIGDPVNFIGPLFGLIPYIRNLMLIKNSRKDIKGIG